MSTPDWAIALLLYGSQIEKAQRAARVVVILRRTS